MLEALNGFLIYVSKKGTIKFISNTVHGHLGLKQVRQASNMFVQYFCPMFSGALCVRCLVIKSIMVL